MLIIAETFVLVLKDRPRIGENREQRSARLSTTRNGAMQTAVRYDSPTVY